MSKLKKFRVEFHFESGNSKQVEYVDESIEKLYANMFCENEYGGVYNKEDGIYIVVQLNKVEWFRIKEVEEDEQRRS